MNEKTYKITVEIMVDAESENLAEREIEILLDSACYEYEIMDCENLDDEEID